MSLEIIYKTKAIWYEGFIAIGIGLMITASIVATDISFHDDYVGFIIESCPKEVQSQFCRDIRQHLNVDSDAQLEIGDNYWNRLFGQAIELFVILFFIRMAFGAMLQWQHVRNIRLTTVIMALIWGASAFVIFTFGMVDILYFIFQGQSIPETMPYLDQGAVFQYTKELTGSPSTVDRNDLFLTNAIGFGILFILIFGNAIVYRIRGYSNRTIA